MGVIYQLDNYVTFFNEKSQDLTPQLTKSRGQSYLLLIAKSSEHSLQVSVELISFSRFDIGQPDNRGRILEFAPVLWKSPEPITLTELYII